MGAVAEQAALATRPGYGRRFTVTERIVHWTHATAFFALLTSGLVLYVPSLSTWISRRNLVKNVHIWTGVAWAAAPVPIFVVANPRPLREAWAEVRAAPPHRPRSSPRPPPPHRPCHPH